MCGIFEELIIIVISIMKNHAFLLDLSYLYAKMQRLITFSISFFVCLLEFIDVTEYE